MPKANITGQSNREPSDSNMKKHGSVKLPKSKTNPIDERYYGREIEDRVRGVRHENRQAIVEEVRLGEQLLLVREPDNQFDKNAIQVVRENSQVVGYIDRKLAQKIAPIFDEFLMAYDAPKSPDGGLFDNRRLGWKYRLRVSGDKVEARLNRVVVRKRLDQMKDRENANLVIGCSGILVLRPALLADVPARVRARCLTFQMSVNIQRPAVDDAGEVAAFAEIRLEQLT